MQKRFYELYNLWKEETKYRSDPATDHFAYIEIVKMGNAVIPLLKANLYDSWLPIHALYDILKTSPKGFCDDDTGRFDKLSELWLQHDEYDGII